MEFVTIGLFCLSLLICLLFDWSILIALAIGLIVFFGYGIHKGYSVAFVLKFSLSGVKTVKNILITFFLIGMMTAIWREAGTIPVIVCFAAKLVHPSVFLLMTFLLNCMISFLTGTAFGTAATMGVICSTMGASLGISPVLMGGAVLSGVYFGDRCSPVSTSALLTASLTDTDIFGNIKKMLKTAVIPFVITCIVYVLVGISIDVGGAVPDLSSVFSKEFILSSWCVLPAVILLVLSLCKVNVKIAMSVSILSALAVSFAVQKTPIEVVPSILFSGYQAENLEVVAMLNGGGIVSMAKVAMIVCISSAYSGIFQNTGLLKSIESSIINFAHKTTPFLAILITSLLTGMIACNQTLTIMLTDQLTHRTVSDKNRFAISLEDSAVVIAPLIPWSIAGAVPLATVEAPMISILFACFLYLLPICGLVESLVWKIKNRKK